MKTRAKWTGRLPEIGDYLQSPHRPRYAYRITAVAIHDYARLYIRDGDAVFEQETTTATFTLERVRPTEVPPGATIHTWRWDKRAPKKGSRR